MSMPIIFQTMEDSLHGIFGSMSLIAIIIMFVMLIAFMFIGIDFRYALMFISPLTLAFVDIGWFPHWVRILFWILIVMFGGYMLWTRIKGEGGG